VATTSNLEIRIGIFAEAAQLYVTLDGQAGGDYIIQNVVP